MNSKHQCSMDNIKTWESLEQLFEAMNESLDYLVLRNTEDITKEFSPAIHGDIDILVRDLKTAIQLMQAIKYHKEPYRVYYEVKVMVLYHSISDMLEIIIIVKSGKMMF